MPIPPLEARLLDMDSITRVTEALKAKGQAPSYLLLSHDDFDGFVNAVMVHPHKYQMYQLKTLGITRVVWAHDLKDGEFVLSTGKGIPKDVQTLSLKATHK